MRKFSLSVTFGITFFLLQFLDLTKSKPYNFDGFGGFDISAGSVYTNGLYVNGVFSLKFLWNAYFYPGFLTILKSPVEVALTSREVFQMMNILQEIIKRFGGNANPPPPLLNPLNVGYPPTKEEKDNFVMDVYYYWLNQVISNLIKSPDGAVTIEGEGVGEVADADWRKTILVFQMLVKFEITGKGHDSTKGAHNGEMVYILKAKMKPSEINENDTIVGFFLDPYRGSLLLAWKRKYYTPLKVLIVVGYVIFFAALSDVIPPYWCLMSLFLFPGALSALLSINMEIAGKLIRTFNFWYLQCQLIILCVSGIILVRERERSGFLILGFVMAILPISVSYFGDGAPPRFV